MLHHVTPSPSTNTVTDGQATKSMHLLWTLIEGLTMVAFTMEYLIHWDFSISGLLHTSHHNFEKKYVF